MGRLVLTRRPGTEIKFIGPNSELVQITIGVVEIRGNQVRIAITASGEWKILRSEYKEKPSDSKKT